MPVVPLPPQTACRLRGERDLCLLALFRKILLGTRTICLQPSCGRRSASFSNTGTQSHRVSHIGVRFREYLAVQPIMDPISFAETLLENCYSNRLVKENGISCSSPPSPDLCSNPSCHV